jgi:hypothetical protein
MRNLAAIIAATVAAASVAAVISLPAGADESASADAQFVSCLRAHGLDIPADTRDIAIKNWIGTHQSDPAVDRAMSACGHDGGGASPEKLVACLRDKGLDAPAAIADLKPWVVQQLQTDAGKAALSACGLNTHPDEKVGDGPPKDKDHAGTGPCAEAKRADVSRARKQQDAKAARRLVPAGT